MLLELEIMFLFYLSSVNLSSTTMTLRKFYRYGNFQVRNSSQSSLQLQTAYQVRSEFECAGHCNRLSNCEVLTLNRTNYCSLYSSDTTLLDLTESTDTQLLSKNSKIKECLNSSYFVDTDQMICRLKFTDAMTCSRDGQCLEAAGLKCIDLECQCNQNTAWVGALNRCVELPIVFDSEILKSKHQQKELLSLIGFESKLLRLLWRGTRDGFGSDFFHSFCDGVNNTITIVKSSSGYVFGGYTSKAWSSSNQGVHTTDFEAFLFTLTNPSNDSRKLVVNAEGSHAVYSKSTYGPAFGIATYSLLIKDDSNQNSNSYVYGKPHIYETINELEGGDFGYYLHGEERNPRGNFQTLEIEVFSVE